MEQKKEIIRDLKNLFWHKLAGMIVFNTDLILISTFISLETVAIYSSYLLLEQMLLTLINVFIAVLVPKIGIFVAQNTKEKSYKSWRSLDIIFLFFSLFLSICFYNLGFSFVQLWLTESYVLSNFTLILITINIFIKLSRGIIENFKNSFGLFDDIYLPISEVIINFIFSITLVFYMKLNGIILGTVISNITIICIAKPILVFRKCFNKSIKEYLKVYGNYLLLISISVLLCQILLRFLNIEGTVNTWFEWIELASLEATIIFIFLFLLFFCFNKDFRRIMKKSFVNIFNIFIFNINNL